MCRREEATAGTKVCLSVLSDVISNIEQPQEDGAAAAGEKAVVIFFHLFCIRRRRCAGSAEGDRAWRAVRVFEIII